MNIKMDKTDVSTSSIIDWKWDIYVKDNVIYNNHIMHMSSTDENDEKKLQMKINGVHETSGKEKKMDFIFDNTKDIFTIVELNKFKKQMSDYINNQFSNIGKTVKTGDVLRYIPNEMSTMSTVATPSFKEEFPEIVKGFGVYKNKNVVVTEYLLEDNVHSQDFVIGIKGKGYNLYDTQTFVQLFGEAVVYLSIFNPKVGTVNLRMDMSSETQDVQVKNIITSLIDKDKIAENGATEPIVSEVSDKIIENQEDETGKKCANSMDCKPGFFCDSGSCQNTAEAKARQIKK